jgi:undecaprenyl diphosphate synthase
MKIPRHIGIIMDGNGRWAKKRGLPRSAGHRAGTDATRTIVRSCGELGVEFLTVYVFSKENWGRPMLEVKLLMDLLVEMIRREVDDLNKNNVRLHAVGDLTRLPEKSRAALLQGMERTLKNSGLNLILAISYGGRAEIVNAAKEIAREAVRDPSLIDQLDEEMFRRYLNSHDFPDAELIIRTGGEKRISNFLLWQSAYAELYFTDELWPDFNKDSLVAAIEDFGKRERRFGKVTQN